MFRIKKRMVLPAAALLACLFLSGCARSRVQPETSKAVTSDRMQIGLSFDSFVIERWLRDRDVFVSTAESLGAEVNVQNANGDIQEQIAQIEYFIKKKMDVIVIVAIDGESLTEVVTKAKDAGIKVISYDRLIKDAGTDLYVSFDNEKVGALMGETLRKELPDGGRIFAIYGSRSDNNVSQITEGFTGSLEGSGIEIVYTTYCDNWLAELAFSGVEEGLQTAGEADGVMCGNDDLAGQAIRALAEHRLAGKVPVVAQDAELAACQRIMEGTQTMTVYKSVNDEASAAAVLAVALGNGEDITAQDAPLRVEQTIDDGSTQVPYYRIDPVAVNAENMDSVIIDSGFHRREDVYLNVPETESVTDLIPITENLP